MRARAQLNVGHLAGSYPVVCVPRQLAALFKSISCSIQTMPAAVKVPKPLATLTTFRTSFAAVWTLSRGICQALSHLTS